MSLLRYVIVHKSGYSILDQRQAVLVQGTVSTPLVRVKQYEP